MKNQIRSYKGFYSFFLGILCWPMVGCSDFAHQNHEFEVITYSPEHLPYPKTKTQISNAVQQKFQVNFFSPWRRKPEVLMSSIDSIPGKTSSYLKSYLDDDEWYGENKKPHKKFIREEIVNNVSIEDFPNFLKKGIVVAHTNLRRLPSHKPGFDNYSNAGEGYPFDYFQETNLWANTPLQLLHLTIDKQWCFVVSPYYKGWVKMHDIGIVSDDFIKTWLTGNYAMPSTDKLRLSNSKSNFAINAKLGMVLPFENADDDKSVYAFYVNSDENQEAKILRARVSSEDLAFSDFEFNAMHLESLVSQLHGKPYGWGGNLENRDCSSMIRDLMATFQIWLPRDSKDQIEIGQQFELKGNLNEKMDLIKEKGIPFQTILRKKGHNMLYVGNNEKGEPLIFHAIWGLKTTYTNEQLSEYLKNYPIEGIHQEDDGTLKGRHIIGEAVITSVMAGEGNDGITNPLLEEIYAMTNILDK